MKEELRFLLELTKNKKKSEWVLDALPTDEKQELVEWFYSVFPKLEKMIEDNCGENFEKLSSPKMIANNGGEVFVDFDYSSYLNCDRVVADFAISVVFRFEQNGELLDCLGKLDLADIFSYTMPTDTEDFLLYLKVSAQSLISSIQRNIMLCFHAYKLTKEK
ncbi:hypothetical protein HMPREF1430_00938, partial [Helicobacter pylori GAM96Ai]|uniref:hypothetical protein n=1 Tax=Helicobacter pylori TaxID=210 RepID=UPI0002B93102